MLASSAECGRGSGALTGQAWPPASTPARNQGKVGSRSTSNEGVPPRLTGVAHTRAIHALSGCAPEAIPHGQKCILRVKLYMASRNARRAVHDFPCAATEVRDHCA